MIRLVATTTLCLLASACTFFLDWDPDGLPCDADHLCANGYSCQVNKCVANGSVQKGDTCNRDEQCQEGLICPPGRFTCQTPCSNYFVPTSQCLSNEFCAPNRVSGTDQYVGACAPSECDKTADCRSGKTCVAITTSASACVEKCMVSFNSGVYVDSCTEVQTEKYCQPIGIAGQQVLACLDAATVGGNEGDPCTPIEQPCLPGLMCDVGFCRSFCSTGTGCSGTDLCCTRPLVDGSYQICLQGC